MGNLLALQLTQFEKSPVNISGVGMVVGLSSRADPITETLVGDEKKHLVLPIVELGNVNRTARTHAEVALLVICTRDACLLLKKRLASRALLRRNSKTEP